MVGPFVVKFDNSTFFIVRLLFFNCYSLVFDQMITKILLTECFRTTKQNKGYLTRQISDLSVEKAESEVSQSLHWSSIADKNDQVQPQQVVPLCQMWGSIRVGAAWTKSAFVEFWIAKLDGLVRKVTRARYIPHLTPFKFLLGFLLTPNHWRCSDKITVEAAHSLDSQLIKNILFNPTSAV